MPADKQIVRSWRFWAGILVGAALALALAVLMLLGHLRPNEASDANEAAGRAENGFAMQ